MTRRAGSRTKVTSKIEVKPELTWGADGLTATLGSLSVTVESEPATAPIAVVQSATTELATLDSLSDDGGEQSSGMIHCSPGPTP